MGAGCAATIALVAGSYLVLTTPDPAASEGNTEGRQGGWLAQLWPFSQNDSADEEAARGPKARSKADGKGDVSRPGSQSDKKSEAKAKKKVAEITPDPAPSIRSKADPAPNTRNIKAEAKGDLFLPGPQYDKKYDSNGNVDIYGAKKAVEPPRPLELGREQYTSGIYDKGNSLLGELNLLAPGLSIYGDWRTAVAYNSNAGKDIAQIATRLNIDVDLKFTATERIHAFFTPLQKNAKFTRCEFAGGAADGKCTLEFDPLPQTLFFEGDVGSLYSGFSGTEASFDLPFTVGLFPLFLQNGIWANDAILGGAVSLTAKNSKRLGLANYDVTVFAAFDQVDNAGILGAGNRKANLVGVTTFIDAFGGYIEAGYAAIQAQENAVLNGVQVNQVAGEVTHFLTAAYTRRIANTLSNTTRVFANFGDGKNSEGYAIISENSIISSLPSTLLPYANFFIGYGNPQSLVDGNNAGILKNVGINFETDALTGFPKLNDTGSNTYGGAIGIQYLFNLDQQLVFEVAAVQPFDSKLPGAAGTVAVQPQYGFGVRYQIALDRAWLFRADATYQILEGGAHDNFGVRTEIRRKF
jgi:hypothetical protein